MYLIAASAATSPAYEKVPARNDGDSCLNIPPKICVNWVTFSKLMVVFFFNGNTMELLVPCFSVVYMLMYAQAVYQI